MSKSRLEEFKALAKSNREKYPKMVDVMKKNFIKNQFNQAMLAKSETILDDIKEYMIENPKARTIRFKDINNGIHLAKYFEYEGEIDYQCMQEMDFEVCSGFRKMSEICASVNIPMKTHLIHEVEFDLKVLYGEDTKIISKKEFTIV